MKTLRPRTTTRTRTPLVLRPLQEKMNYILREWLDSLMLGDVLKWSPSPHIYSGEPPSPRPWNQQGTPGTDVVSQSESATSKPEGGGAHGLVGRPVGRPASHWAHRPSPCCCGLFSGPTGQWFMAWLLPCWISSLVAFWSMCGDIWSVGVCSLVQRVWLPFIFS